MKLYCVCNILLAKIRSFAELHSLISAQFTAGYIFEVLICSLLVSINKRKFKNNSGNGITCPNCTQIRAVGGSNTVLLYGLMFVAARSYLT